MFWGKRLGHGYVEKLLGKAECLVDPVDPVDGHGSGGRGTGGWGEPRRVGVYGPALSEAPYAPAALSRPLGAPSARGIFGVLAPAIDGALPPRMRCAFFVGAEGFDRLVLRQA
jgi:hypothetical protein